ncbi:MAG: hypothetical protein Alpg2KO_29260 [Alphaproteobacteria bacterium]
MADGTIKVLDLVVVVALFASAILAMMRGFTREALALGGWIVALLGAVFLLPAGKAMTYQFIDNKNIADLTAFVALFIMILCVCAVINHKISKRIENSALGPVNRSLGFAFGLIRGLVVVALAYLLFSVFIPPGAQPQVVQTAKLRPLVSGTALVVQEVMPQGIRFGGEVTETVENSRPADVRERPRPPAATRSTAPSPVRARSTTADAPRPPSRPADRRPPAVATPTTLADDSPSGYSNRDRQQLERLLETELQ